MLEVYDAELVKADITDVEAVFSQTLINVDDNVKNFIKAIDQGELIDSNRFIGINVSKTFFNEDCSDNKGCRDFSIYEKSSMYRGEYECFDMDDFTLDKAWDLHSRLLSEANKMIEKYNKSGYLKVGLYPTIK